MQGKRPRCFTDINLSCDSLFSFIHICNDYTKPWHCCGIAGSKCTKESVRSLSNDKWFPCCSIRLETNIQAAQHHQTQPTRASWFDAWLIIMQMLQNKCLLWCKLRSRWFQNEFPELRVCTLNFSTPHFYTTVWFIRIHAFFLSAFLHEFIWKGCFTWIKRRPCVFICNCANL